MVRQDQLAHRAPEVMEGANSVATLDDRVKRGPGLLEELGARQEMPAAPVKLAPRVPSRGVKPLSRAVAGDTNPEVSAAAGAPTGRSFGITVTG